MDIEASELKDKIQSGLRLLKQAQHCLLNDNQMSFDLLRFVQSLIQLYLVMGSPLH